MKIIVIVGVLLLLLLIPSTKSHAEEPIGSLQVNMKSTTGEMADYHGMVLKIYSDKDQTPITIQPTNNPFDVPLPLNHRYKVEAYASSMYCDVDFVEMTTKNQQVELSIPIPGSIRLTALYSDDGMPIQGALVSLHSLDNTYKFWTNSTTDPDGNTMRFWLQPTLTNGNYYVADIYLDGNLSYTFSPITVSPGVSKDIKITTPWPRIIDQLITIAVYGPDSEKISGLKDNLVVKAYDDNGNEIATSKVSHSGEASFSGLKVGTYVFRLTNSTLQDFGNTTITLTGKTPTISIFTSPIKPDSKAPNIIMPVNPVADTSSPTPNTNSSLTKDITEKQITSSIPQWIKNVADWWSKGQVSDTEFLKAIEYLVNNNIISVQQLQSG